MIKKEYIEEMFQRHFKTVLEPQADSEEKSIHSSVVRMDAIRIMENIDTLQAMLHHEHQLLNLYNAKAHQDACYTPISERKWSKPKQYGDIQDKEENDEDHSTHVESPRRNFISRKNTDM